MRPQIVELDTPAQIPSTARITLRLLATSDVHAHILPWDDLANVAAPGRGLAQLATLIAKARAETAACLLFDNGDFLNGSPLGDHVAETRKVTTRAPHPMIAAMNALNYDAATLGNHEFSNGLPLLKRALSHARFPLVSSNLSSLDRKNRRRAFLPRALLLRRMLPDHTGTLHPVMIGVLGFLPPQTAQWEQRNLAGKIVTEDILTSARALLPRLRRAGADIVVALSHSGLGTFAPMTGAENVSCALAGLDGIDAVIAGHTHQVYPPPQGAPDLPQIDCGKPLVMPGFFGSHLGVIDLTLRHDGARWRVAESVATVRPVALRQGTEITALVPACDKIAILAHSDTAAMHAQAETTIGHTAHPLHSYFALIGHSPVQDLLARAQAANMRSHLASTAEACLPLLVSVAPFKAGGRGGPENFTDIPAGALTARNIHDLYIHPNSAVALKMSGREVALWLERAVSLFHQVTPGAQDAPLIDADFPAYNFDMIHGLGYGVDLSQPARFDCLGQEIAPDARRIVDLTYQGLPMNADQQFIVVTNSYRASGGAGFAGTDCANVVMEDSRPLRRILQDYVAGIGAIPAPDPSDWRFVSMPGTSVVFDSGADAVAHVAAVPGLVPLGLRPSGFMRFRLTL